MSSLIHTIASSVGEALMELDGKCEGCPQVEVCQEQDNGGEPRYCWPMIRAAILGLEEWNTNHRGWEVAG